MTPRDRPARALRCRCKRHCGATARGRRDRGPLWAHTAEVIDGGIRLVPDTTLEIDRVVTIPRLRGPHLAGLTCSEDGFVPPDRHGLVCGTGMSTLPATQPRSPSSTVASRSTRPLPSQKPSQRDSARRSSPGHSGPCSAACSSPGLRRASSGPTSRATRRDLGRRGASALVAAGQDRRRPPRRVLARRRPPGAASACGPCNDDRGTSAADPLDQASRRRAPARLAGLGALRTTRGQTEGPAEDRPHPSACARRPPAREQPPAGRARRAGSSSPTRCRTTPRPSPASRRSRRSGRRRRSPSTAT